MSVAVVGHALQQRPSPEQGDDLRSEWLHVADCVPTTLRERVAVH